jgi:ATP-dependent exoDNAse (exonuclease V) beta subunit
MNQLVSSSKLDFDGILTLTQKIIHDIDTDFEYIMVDEFQDTNSLQIEIINAISKDKDKNLFVVGDSKQSIYAFQGAELEVFNNAVGTDAVTMNENYRSDKKILEFVNKSFFNLFKQSDEEFISTNYEATFEDKDKLTHEEKTQQKGSIEFMITVDDKEEVAKQTQWKNIAKFIKGLKDNKIEGYQEVKDKIKEDKKAIGILFDSKTQMMKLKYELNKIGIECKVSATDKFYETKEVNDIFIVLKATELLKRKQYKLQKQSKDNVLEDEIKLSQKDKFYVAGALRSNIFRYDESKIVTILNGSMKNIIAIFQNYIDAISTMRLSALIKHITDDSKLLDIYNYVGDIHQRSANIEKLIKEAIVYEDEMSSNLFDYLKELERFIYFSSDLKVDEAFYKSKSVESVELCTIHSTKGLDYPMVILAQSEKNVLSRSSGEMGLNFNTFALNQNGTQEEYGAVGFAMGEYQPLIYRILKKINKNKDEAERKRLLYVALTRAKHNIIVSGSMWKVKAGLSSIKDSYLSWLSQDSFEITQQQLWDEEGNGEDFNYIDKTVFQDITGKIKRADSYPQVIYKPTPLTFNENKKILASATSKQVVNENIINQAIIGTKIHSILERYWDKFEDEDILNMIYLKYAIFEDEAQAKIKTYIENFKTTTTYKALKNEAEYKFELELHTFKDEKHTQGIIDLLYFDKEKDGWIIVDFKSNNIKDKKDLVAFAKDKEYDQQLNVYQELCEAKDMKIVGKLLLFLEDGSEVLINMEVYSSNPKNI